MKKISKRIITAMLTLCVVMGTAFAHPQVSAFAANTTPVTNLTQVATYDEETHVKVSYTTVAGIKNYGYTVYDVNGNVVTSGDTYDGSLSINSLSQGQTYYVEISTYADYKKATKLSTSARLEVVTAPSVLSGSTYRQIDATADSATLSWTPVAGATSYVVAYYFDRNQKMYATTATNSIALPLIPNVQYEADVYACRTSSVGYTATSDRDFSLDSSVNNNYFIASIPTLAGQIAGTFYTSSLSLEVTGDRSETADGYYYEVYDHKGSKLITSLESTSSTGYENVSFRESDRNKVFYVTVKAYMIDGNGVKHYSAPSAQYICKGVDTRLSSKKKKQITVKWDKISGLDRYVIYAAKGNQNDFGQYKKVATVKGSKSSYTLKKIGKKKLASKKTYSVCIMGEKKINGQYVAISDTRYYVKIKCK